MTTLERRATFSLASIYAFRMLGLFMILPIFSLYTAHLQYANATRIGLALGIYGLTQALLQIPFGMSSDRIGRKPVIILGLILFMLGSIIAATSHNIYGIILGRGIQGAGAIGSTLIALLADTTTEKNRLKAMSIIGMTIGFSFVAAMILGPILNNLVGLTGIFWFTALLALCGIIILVTLVPTPKSHLPDADIEPMLSQCKTILSNFELWRLNFGIFALHAMLMALFIVIPLMLIGMGLSANKQWLIYVPVLMLACLFMLPLVIIAEAKQLLKPIFIAAVGLLVLTQLLLWYLHHNILTTSIILCAFFTAFTLLEACLPSLISKIAPPGGKGTAMGIYSSSQFLGIFFGGTCGGLIVHQFGADSLFLFTSLIGIVWLLLAIPMKQPLYLAMRSTRSMTPVSKR